MVIDSSSRQQASESQYQHHQFWLHLFALGTLILIIGVLLLHWPVPTTGMTIDITTGVIYGIAPDSAAARVGIQPGDQIVAIYDYRWEDSDKQLFLFPLEWRGRTTIPVQIARNGILQSLALNLDPPDQALLRERMLWFAMGCICWLTGYLIGVSRRHRVMGTPLISWFWLAVGAIVGVYNFVWRSSYPLTVVMQWLLIAGVVPCGIYIHHYFPPRGVRPALTTWMNRWLIGGICFLQVALVLYWFTLWPRTSQLADFLSTMVLPVLVLGLFATSLVLWSGYQQTTIAHIRRQIRLIGFTYLIVALAWLLLSILPGLVSLTSLVPGAWLFCLFALIPLAYLAGAVVPDLYRIDRILVWFSVHLLTGSLLIGILALIIHLLGVSGPYIALWLVLVLVIGYQPLHGVLQRMAAWLVPHDHAFQSLARAEHAMASTLEIEAIVPALCTGIAESFGSPALAFYRADDDEPTQLRLSHVERLTLPPQVHSPALHHLFSTCQGVYESKQLIRLAQDAVFEPADEALLLHPGIVLWCPLCSPQGALLGLLALGMRNDLDPYRPADFAALRRYLDTAQLALTNCATFREQQQAEQMIRTLYRQVQQTQEETAATIARELHDDVINVGIRTNILALEQALNDVKQEPLRSTLQGVLAGERAVSATLRDACGRLYPMGIDDPFGLAILVRHLVESLQANWSGRCSFTIYGENQAVAPAVQREVLRVVREAVVNAIKHSNGTNIDVVLHYPLFEDLPASVVIRDNGRERKPLQPRRDSWGIRNMRESARAAHAHLEFAYLDGAGLEVTLRFPTIELIEGV